MAKRRSAAFVDQVGIDAVRVGVGVIRRTYKVYGQIFFASADHFIDSFDFKEVIEHVVIDVSDAHLWDLTSVGALDKVILKFRREGTRVDVVGMNEASSTLVNRLAIHDKPEALEIMTDH
ncbi:MAG: STAS domain-containing protein [Caldilineaceae bacterium]